MNNHNIDVGKKVTILSFLAMFGVVMIHSNSIGPMTNPVGWNVVTQKILTRTFTEWAVPFFFVMSGFWFARGRYLKDAGEKYGTFITKKAKTLLIPYLLWAVIGAAIALPLYVFNNFVNHEPLLARTFLSAPGAWAKIDRLLGIACNGPSGNLALWYVRTLLILFVLAPVWKAVYRKLGKWLLIPALALALVVPETRVSYMEVKLGSISWFLVGVGASQWIAEGRKIPLGVVVTAGLGWASLSVASAVGYAVVPSMIPLCGIVSMWGGYDLVVKKEIEVPKYMKQSFWVYCLHGSVVGYFLAGIPFVVGKTDISTCVTTLITPPIVIGLCLFAAHLCEKMNGKFFALLSGGRG